MSGFVSTFKPGTYNERDNRSTVAITKEYNGVPGCYHKELNKGGSTIAGVYTLVVCVGGGSGGGGGRRQACGN